MFSFSIYTNLIVTQIEPMNAKQEILWTWGAGFIALKENSKVLVDGLELHQLIQWYRYGSDR